MKPDYTNFHDPFPIAITVSLQETLTTYDVVSCVPKEISRFCKNFGGLLERRVRDVKYRSSLIPKGKLEIDGSEKAQGFAVGVQQNGRPYWSTTRSPKIYTDQKSKVLWMKDVPMTM